MKKMKIMIMTDMEGVTGVHDYKKCCTADGCYYQTSRRLLTLEVNAAIEGFFAGGATEIIVATGHGYDSLDRELLDERVEMLTGHFQPIWPWGLDESFDALAFVGQHAKAGSDYAHLAHTGSFAVLDFRVMWEQLLAQAVALCQVLSGFYGLPGWGDEGYVLDWGNGVLYDRDALWQDYRQMVSDGLIKPEIALGWRFHLPAETQSQQESIRKKFMPETNEL